MYMLPIAAQRLAFFKEHFFFFTSAPSLSHRKTCPKDKSNENLHSFLRDAFLFFHNGIGLRPRTLLHVVRGVSKGRT